MWWLDSTYIACIFLKTCFLLYDAHQIKSSRRQKKEGENTWHAYFDIIIHTQTFSRTALKRLQPFRFVHLFHHCVSVASIGHWADGVHLFFIAIDFIDALSWHLSLDWDVVRLCQSVIQSQWTNCNRISYKYRDSSLDSSVHFSTVVSNTSLENQTTYWLQSCLP